MKKYENAQSDNAMKRYLSEFVSQIKDGSILNQIDIPNAIEEFESTETYKNTYLSQFANVSDYTFEKDSSSYLTEEPIYDIYADDKQVAQITLSGTNERTIFGILTIMDWDVKEVTPVLITGSYNYNIQLPDDFTATINGVTMSEDYFTGTEVDNPDFANVSEYVDMPKFKEYEVQGLLNEPEIKVYNGSGEEVEYTADESGNITVDYQIASTDMPQEYYDQSLAMAKVWDNFMTDDLGGSSHGLATVQQYLIKDSYYWNMADEYAHGEDISSISDHTLLNPPYSNISLTNYISYGENCYSVHIYFDKTMYLQKAGSTRVNTINATFYFVYYDDTDDGEDNPHWAIADMVATTNE